MGEPFSPGFWGGVHLEYKNYLEHGNGELGYPTFRFLICKEMHWDYWTWAAQPVWYIKEIWEHLSAERAAIPDRGRDLSQASQLEAGSQRRR